MYILTLNTVRQPYIDVNIDLFCEGVVVVVVIMALYGSITTRRKYKGTLV